MKENSKTQKEGLLENVTEKIKITREEMQLILPVCREAGVLGANKMKVPV